MSGNEKIAAQIKFALESMLAPVKGAISVGWGGSDPATLHPAEYEYTLSMSQARARQFSTGRYYARLALNMLGIDNAPVLRDADGAPVWPSSVKGSLSHANEFTAVAVIDDPTVLGIGIDIEVDNKPFPKGVGELVFDQHEQELLQTRAFCDAYQMFSAKEATFKAVRHATGHHLGWDEISIAFDSKWQRYSPLIKHVTFNDMYCFHGCVTSVGGVSIAACIVSAHRGVT